LLITFLLWAAEGGSRIQTPVRQFEMLVRQSATEFFNDDAKLLGS